MTHPPDSLPTQGPLCDHCGLRIPQFEWLAVADEQRIRDLMTEGQRLRAMHELTKATRCPMTWAKVWVQHKGRTKAREPGTICSYCGGRLRSPRAKQCLECGMDWHDVANPRRLGTG